MQVVLPTDVVIAKEVTRGTEYKTVGTEKFPASWHIVDLGERAGRRSRTPSPTRRRSSGTGRSACSRSRRSPTGRKAIARFLADKAEHGVTVVVGGGDSVAAIEQQGLADEDDPHQHRRRRLARVPRGPRAAGDRRPPGSTGRDGRAPKATKAKAGASA